MRIQITKQIARGDIIENSLLLSYNPFRKIYMGNSKNRGIYYKIQLDEGYLNDPKLKFILENVNGCTFYIESNKVLYLKYCYLFYDEIYHKSTMHESITYVLNFELYVVLSKKLFTKFKLKF